MSTRRLRFRPATPFRLRAPWGFTLVELVTVLALVGAGAWAAVPSARRLVETAWLLTAREAVVRGIARGRVAAVTEGGAVVTVTRSPPRIGVVAGGVVLHDAPIGDGRTVVVLTGGADSLSLRFDALGIGRFASASVGLRRGDAEGGLVLSSYGRVRRR